MFYVGGEKTYIINLIHKILSRGLLFVTTCTIMQIKYDGKRSSFFVAYESVYQLNYTDKDQPMYVNIQKVMCL